MGPRATRTFPLLSVTLAVVFAAASSPATPPVPPRPEPDETLAFEPPVVVRTTSLARADPGKTDEPAREPEPIEGEARIDVAANGALRFEGRPVTQDGLVVALTAFADKDRDENSSQRISRRAVRVVTDPKTRWRHVRRALSDCTRPEARIGRLRLTVGERTETIAVARDRLVLPGRRVKYEVKPVLTARVQSSRLLGLSRIRLFGMSFRRHRQPFKGLAEGLELIVHANPGLDGEVHADGCTRAGDVIRVLGVYRGAGVARTHLAGIPAPHWGTEQFIRSLVDKSPDRHDVRVQVLVADDAGFLGYDALITYLEWEGRKVRDRVGIALIPFADKEVAADPEDLTPAIDILSGLGWRFVGLLRAEARGGSVGAIRALSQIDPLHAGIAIEDLIIAASSPTSEVRSEAVRALPRICRRDDPRVRRLFERIAEDEFEVAETRETVRRYLAKSASASR